MNFFRKGGVFISLAIIFSIHCVQAQTDLPAGENFTLDGKVNGMSNGTMMLAYADPSGENIMLDSAVIDNGIFHFKGAVTLPVPATLYIKGTNNRYAEHNKNFYLENGAITVLVYKDSINVSKVFGSHSNDDRDSITALMAPYYETRQALNKVQQFATKQNLPDALKRVEAIYNELPNAQRKLIVDYSLGHPNSYAITSMLSMNFTNNQSELSLLKKVYNHFSDPVKKSVGGKDIAGLITRMARVQNGNKAPEFSMPDENGNIISLSSFKGKYILLDFWASWCVPCRAESPNLVKAYEKYKDKNFTILSISLDDQKDKQKWIDAFKKDGMTWTQLSDLKGYAEKGVRELYSVQGIPDNFLIDPQGKIIVRGLRGEDVSKTLNEIIN